MVLEGTYPYVPGGVSSWVHGLVQALPERRFTLLHISPSEGSYGQPCYQMPDNITGLTEVFCHVKNPPLHDAAPGKVAAGHARLLRGLERLHLDDQVDDELVADLAAADLSVDQFLHGDGAFELICHRLYPQLAPG